MAARIQIKDKPDGDLIIITTVPELPAVGDTIEIMKGEYRVRSRTLTRTDNYEYQWTIYVEIITPATSI